MNIKMDLFACWNCEGNGETFEGAMMRPNPSSYADYDEVWRPCEVCNGKGWAFRYLLKNIPHLISHLRREYFTKPVTITEEDEIPF